MRRYEMWRYEITLELRQPSRFGDHAHVESARQGKIDVAVRSSKQKNRASPVFMELPDERQALAASAAVAASAGSGGRSISSTSAIGALSPCLKPNFRIRR